MGKFRKYLLVSFSIVTIAGSSLAVAKRQDITDWLILRNYTPSGEIVALSERTTMSELGKKLFYVYDPQLLDKEGFNAQCVKGEQSIVLGCYDGQGIYLYTITDAQLDGVEEVTSAHEMLHAAYARLSSGEKEEIDALVARAVEEGANDRIKNLIESYRVREPESLTNEMHSIVGTEMRDLPVELEQYYSRYFLNRERVVEYSENYEAVFTNLQTQVEQIDADLLLRKSEIDSLEAELESQASELQEWEVRLKDYRANNQIAEYNSEVDDFNRSINSYNSKLQKTRNLIAEYNQKVVERNNLAVQQNQLIKSLDSKATDL